MAFHEVRLPDDVERGAMGGPMFNTTVFELSSGFEKRNINWSAPRLSWDVGYGIQTKDDYSDVLAFFYAREGKAHGFRFKDWTDFEIGDDAADTEQAIGTGDDTTQQFQVVKRYSSGSTDYDRIITKLVSGTVRVFKDSVEQGSGYTVDYDTGVITFTSAPAGAVEIGVICEFDVPVRFDTDRMEVSAETFDAGSIPNIAIKELRI